MPGPGVRVLPNAITVLALCSGLSAVYFALEGNTAGSVGAITLAALLDSLDGRLARLLDATSRIGAELDSLADCISFGVAPAVVLFIWGIGRFRLAYQPRSTSSSSGRTVIVSPSAAEIASRVRSSSVGPRPPVTMTTSERSSACWTVALSRPMLSPTWVTKKRSMPRPVSCWARYCELVSRISPSSSSVPTAIISAFNHGLPTQSEAFKRGLPTQR